MLNRQKIALKFIDRAGGRIGRLDLVKLLFLLSKESRLIMDSGTFYQFLPYKRGPFSFALYNELDALIRDGIVGGNESNFELVKELPAPVRQLEKSLNCEIAAVWQKYGHMTTGQLVDFVYDKYHWYTVNSERLDRLKQSLPVADPGVYTAGYEGLQIDGFLDLLLRRGIKTVIDVRANPVSRKYGFYKTTLSRLCQDVNIAYCHFPQVGIPLSWRSDLSTYDDYQRLFVRYENEILPGREEVISEIAQIMSASPSVLLCQEKDPDYCHRTRLAKAISAKSGMMKCDLRHAV